MPPNDRQKTRRLGGEFRPIDYEVLAVLREATGPLDARGIEQRTDAVCSRATIHRSVSRLEETELVENEPPSSYSAVPETDHGPTLDEDREDASSEETSSPERGEEVRAVDWTAFTPSWRGAMLVVCVAAVCGLWVVGSISSSVASLAGVLGAFGTYWQYLPETFNRA